MSESNRWYHGVVAFLVLFLAGCGGEVRVDDEDEYSTSEAALSITGDDRGNALDGTEGSDYIKGMGGNDKIRGLGGDDVVNGNQGDDVVNGNQGNDIVRGGSGNDVVYGGSGNDTLYGDLGDDWCYGDLGDDTFVYVQGGGVDRIIDTSGSNRINIRNSSDTGPIDATLLRRRQSGNDLIIDVSGGGQIQVENYYSYAGNWTIDPGPSSSSLSEGMMVRFYSSRDQAGKAACATYWNPSINNNKEYGGVIYRVWDTDLYGFAIVEGSPGSVNVQACYIPNETSIVGWWHTHPMAYKVTTTVSGLPWLVWVGAPGPSEGDRDAMRYSSDAPYIYTAYRKYGDTVVVDSRGRPILSDGNKMYCDVDKNAMHGKDGDDCSYSVTISRWRLGQTTPNVYGSKSPGAWLAEVPASREMMVSNDTGVLYDVTFTGPVPTARNTGGFWGTGIAWNNSLTDLGNAAIKFTKSPWSDTRKLIGFLNTDPWKTPGFGTMFELNQTMMIPPYNPTR